MRQGLFDDNLMSEFNEAKNNLQIPINKIKLSFWYKVSNTCLQNLVNGKN